MIQEMLDRWSDQNKPLFMLAKDFKDHIILNFELEVKLQLHKWLSQTKEIDIFEIMTMLIIFCRGNVK